MIERVDVEATVSSLECELRTTSRHSGVSVMRPEIPEHALGDVHVLLLTSQYSIKWFNLNSEFERGLHHTVTKPHHEIDRPWGWLWHGIHWPHLIEHGIVNRFCLVLK